MIPVPVGLVFRKGSRTKFKLHKERRPSKIKMTDAENESLDANDSSSTSCLNEFETFADEVADQIPEVDPRGRLKRSKSETTASLQYASSEISIRSERPTGFFKVLLSPRTPYEEFHRLFKNTPRDQFPINDFSCALSREILLQGRIYISQSWICFYSNIFGWETQVTIDCTKVVSISREKTAYVVPNAILICSEDGEKHFFSSFLSRETVYKLLVDVWNEANKGNESNKEKHQDSVETAENVVQATGDEKMDKIEDKDQNSSRESDENDNIHNPCCTPRQAPSREEDSGCCECQSEHSITDRTTTDGRHDWGIRTLQKDKDLNERTMFKPGTHSIAEQGSLRISECNLAMLLASATETIYSYLQVSFQLLRRLKSVQLFILVTSFVIMILLMCSGFLLYRISVLESKVLGSPIEPEKIIMHQTMKQIWTLREQVYHAEISRLKSIVSANLNAVMQVKDTLKMLQEDLTAQSDKNCTPLDNGTCVKLG